jgi:hypothetical protein
MLDIYAGCVGQSFNELKILTYARDAAAKIFIQRRCVFPA